MNPFVHDVRFALRLLRRSPGFALGVIAILGLGIAAATALFSIVDAAILRPLPFPDPGLNFRDVQQLAKGETAAHRKLKRRLNSFLGNGTRSANPNKPR